MKKTQNTQRSMLAPGGAQTQKRMSEGSRPTERRTHVHQKAPAGMFTEALFVLLWILFLAPNLKLPTCPPTMGWTEDDRVKHGRTGNNDLCDPVDEGGNHRRPSR